MPGWLSRVKEGAIKMFVGTLQGQFLILFLLFGSIILASSVATVYGLQAQQQDAVIINVAGRQRMLIQQMARFSFGAGTTNLDVNDALQETETLFEQTLLGLRYGGVISYLQDGHTVVLKATTNPEIRQQLDELRQSWLRYRQILDSLQAAQPASDSFKTLLQQVQTESGVLVNQADTIVYLYETEAQRKITLLRFVQFTFLLLMIPLLGITIQFIQGGVLIPLQKLETVANRLAHNDLENATPISGTREVRALGYAFEQMRQSLRASRQALLSLNETLEQRVAQRTRELETLHQISQEITSRLDIQHTLNSITEKARYLLNSEIASLCLIDENQHWLKLQAVSGPSEAIRAEVVAIEDTLPQQVLHSQVALTCGLDSCRGGCGMIKDTYRQHHLAVALRVQNRVIGALCVGSRNSRSFSEQSAEVLSKLAGIAAIALENARLYAQAERVATLEERRRLAADMHDGLVQTLSYLGMMTDQTVEFLSRGQDEIVLERLNRTRDIITTTTAEIRQAIDCLLDETALPVNNFCELVRQNAQTFVEKNGLNFTWKVNVSHLACPSDVAQQIHSIVQESLRNIVQHAQASNVILQIEEAEQTYTLTIRDDGIGFDPNTPPPTGHFGLQIMQARAAHIGATFTVQSEPGNGTRIQIKWKI